MKKLLYLLLLTGCSVLSQTHGQHIDQVILKYGQPLYVKPYNGGMAYFYDSTPEYKPTTMYSRNGYTIINESQVNYYTIIFYTDSRGIITGHETIKKAP